MAFDTIKQSQPHVVQLLENSLKKDRLSHAYLFEGEPGTKKFDTAIYFAQMLLCKSEDNKPCQTCSNCRRIKQGIHPNVYLVEPIKNSIRKNQIQDLQMEFSKTSVEPGKKVYIIKDIDTINLSAANSLLKFLEEPFPNIHAILTTNNVNRMLPTIISRSQVVSFSSLNNAIIESELIDAGYESDVARLLSNLTNSVDDAIKIATEEYFEDALDATKDIYQILAIEEKSALLYFNQNFSILYQEKDMIQLFLSCMILYQKDILHQMEGDIAHIVFQREVSNLELLASQKPKQKRIEELEHMLSLQGRLRSYINERLAFDNLLLQLERR
jgi:DNA polymerase-3 subunit delta'